MTESFWVPVGQPLNHPGQVPACSPPGGLEWRRFSVFIPWKHIRHNSSSSAWRGESHKGVTFQGCTSSPFNHIEHWHTLRSQRISRIALECGGAPRGYWLPLKDTSSKDCHFKGLLETVIASFCFCYAVLFYSKLLPLSSEMLHIFSLSFFFFCGVEW